MSLLTGRIEKDFLGEKEVPNHAYYGIQTIRATENFPITKERMHPELVRAIGIVKKAAAISNVLVNDMSKDVGVAIVEAAEEVIEGKIDGSIHRRSDSRRCGHFIQHECE